MSDFLWIVQVNNKEIWDFSTDPLMMLLLHH